MKKLDQEISALHFFGQWYFDAKTGDLSDGKTTRHLEPQVAKLLDYFLSHQDVLISRDELLVAVWENRIVSDDAINRCVSILRQVLSPDDKSAFIETVVRRGFISHFPAPPAEHENVQKPHRRTQLLLVVLAAVVTTVFYFTFDNPTDPSPGGSEPIANKVPLVAVLPFTINGLENESEFFANGMHDDLLTQLAQLQSIRVISRTSVLEYQNTTRNIRDIGKELGADAVLEGGIQRIGNQVRLNVQLIDSRTDAHLWAEKYDRQLLPATMFAVQTEIASSIANALHSALTDQDSTQLGILPTENMAAYRAYHRAMAIRNSGGVGKQEYADALEEAITLDPAFVRASAELVGWLSLQNFDQQDPDSIRHVEDILEQIRVIAPQSGEYLIAQTYFTYYILKNYERAYQLVVQAEKLRPSDLQVVELKSWIQRRLGDFDGRTESIRLARKLDPKNPIWTWVLATNLVLAHRYDEAGLEIETSGNPTFELLELGSTLKLRENRDYTRQLESIRNFEKEFQQTAHPLRLWSIHIGNRDFEAAEGLLDALLVAGGEDGDPVMPNSPTATTFQMINYWFLQDSEKLDNLLIEARFELDRQRDSDGRFIDNDHHLELAFVNAIEGNTEEAGRLVRAWRRAADEDLAEFAMHRHHACHALGIAGAVAEAVGCIRDVLTEPSFAMPFTEPYLPYYDSIRDTAELDELLHDIEINGLGLN